MTYGLHVSGPSVASIHADGSPSSIARNVADVRSSTAMPVVRSKSIMFSRSGTKVPPLDNGRIPCLTLRVSASIHSRCYPSAFLSIVALCAACAADHVEVYVTTGDRAKLLARETDVRFAAERSSANLPTIVVDDSVVYQQIVGFGAALTDASAWLIQHKLTAGQRDT